MNRRGFLRMALGAVGIAAALGVPELLTKPVAEWVNRRWTEKIEMDDGSVVEVECHCEITLAA